jgi:uncharacterized Zn finger protein
MHNIDDLIADEEEEKAKDKGPATPPDNSDLYPETTRVEVGEVERFFSRVSVVAIRLNGELKIGDRIEMESEEGPVTVEVSSMQIDRKDVESAGAGDSVGIKVETPVKAGGKVYLV